MVTEWVDGTTRTRIIDCVSTWSAKNLESSSEPRSRTVNASLGWGRRLGEGDAVALGDGVGDGEAMAMTWPVASKASLAAGRKYAKLPAIADRAMAKMARAAVRTMLSRLREALAPRPGLLPRDTGHHCRATRSSATVVPLHKHGPAIPYTTQCPSPPAAPRICTE